MTTLTESMSALRTYMDNTEKELGSLQGGRKASASRARKGLQQIKALCHVMRKDVVDYVRTLPTKKKNAMPESAPPESEPEEPVPPAKDSKKRRTKKDLP
jgi:hypothetical protein